MGAWLGPIVAAVALMALELLIRPWLVPKVWSGSPLAEWHETAQWIPWRTRWRIARANFRGTAAPPEHAELAAHRAQLLLDHLEGRKRSQHSRALTRLAGNGYRVEGPPK